MSCRHTPAYAHSRAQRARASSAALRLRLHSSTQLRPAATDHLRLRHVNTQLPTSSPTHNSTQHLPSICSPSFVFLTSFPWSSTHNRGHKQATAHSRFWHYFFYSVVLFQEKTLNCIEGLLFVLFERNWTTRLFFSTFHIYDYLLRYFCVVFLGVFFVNVKIFYWFMEKWTCSSSAMSLWSRWRSIGFCTHEEINVEELLLLMYWTCGQLTLSRLSV